MTLHVWFLIPAWGRHTSTHATIMASLAASPNLEVTMIYGASIKTKVEQDLSTYPSELRSRLTLKPIGEADTQMPELMPMMSMELLNFAGTASPRPTKFIIDTLGGSAMYPMLKEKCPGTEVWVSWTGTVTSMWTTVVPAPDGVGNYKQVLGKYVREDSSDEDKSILLEQIMGSRNGGLKVDGTVVRVPGMPDMYDYEREAENVPNPFPGFLSMCATFTDIFLMADGILVASAECLESEAVKAVRGELGLNAVAAGAAVTARAWEKGKAHLADGTIKTFLDAQGKGVLYIAFGSMFWPRDHFDTILEYLMDTSHPFLFRVDDPQLASLSNDLKERIANCPTAMMYQGWADQVGILNHPAISYFLMHGGWNSTQESLLAGKPMIVWPLCGHTDQTLNGAWVSTRDEPLGFELCQIRQGEAKRPAKRGIKVTGSREDVIAEIKGILAKCDGPEGKAIMSNVGKMRSAMIEEKAGAAKRRLKAFAE